MKGKLLKFNEFASSILPLEADFLIYFQHFEDPSKQQILENIVTQAKNPEQKIIFDSSIDKRKYSYVKAWCVDVLRELDVDVNLEKLLNWEKEILTDHLSAKEDRAFLKLLHKTNPSDFNFLKIYEISRYYRHYLQIRLRYKDYHLVHQFLQKFRTDYEFSRLVNDKLHETTHEIITDYSQKSNVAGEEALLWLSSLFNNDKLDGYNRLLAWVRIIFIAHNRRQYENIANMFVRFESLVASGKMYSKRIIVNFYSQNLLLYAAKRDFEKAAYYGYLSIKEKNNDYLYYINNLAAVLLRAHRPENALQVLKDSHPIAKESLNFHNRIGHTAYFIFALIDTGKSVQAESHAFVFLTAFKKEILENRWHLFFTAYIKSMLLNANYNGVIKIYQQFKLKERDGRYRDSANYAVSIPWMHLLAAYKVSDIDLPQFKTSLKALLAINTNYSNTHMTQQDLLSVTRTVLKSEFSKISI